MPFVEDGSKGFTITHKQKPVAMCGVTPLDDYNYRGKIWFLGTDDIDNIAIVCNKFVDKVYIGCGDLDDGVADDQPRISVLIFA